MAEEEILREMSDEDSLLQDSNSPMDDMEDILDSSSDDEENDDLIVKLSQEVEANPYLYDAHIQLISALRKKGDLDNLRTAREKMYALYPLTEELWLNWINDELNLAISKEEKLNIFQLFEKAVKDYMSVNLWIEYGQYSIGLMGELEGGIKTCRDIFERGLTAVGLHVTKGSLIWETFREFEMAILGTIQPSDDSISDQQNEETEKQRQEIINLFKRQLSVPLLDMKDAYKELENFVEGEIDSSIQLGFNKALSKLNKIMPYEDALVQAEAPKLEAYMNYIDFEIAEDQPSRIQCLFERAIVDNCLCPDLWKRYTDYLYSKLNIESVILPVYERAIRNCPWSVDIWQGHLRALEKHGHSFDEIKGIAEKAFASGFSTSNEIRQLWMTYLEYLRRQVIWDSEDKTKLELLRSTFERAHSLLSESFGLDGDPQCEILQYWARVEAGNCKNMEKVREIWNDIMQSGQAKYANMWLEFINLERLSGDSKHVRKTFTRALQAASDWPESIGNAWINFERDEGDLCQLENAISKVSTRIKVMSEQRQKTEETSCNKKLSPFSKKKNLKGGLPAKKSQQNSEVTNNIVEKRGGKRKLKEAELNSVDEEGFVIPKPKAAKTQKKSENSSSRDQSSLEPAGSSKEKRTTLNNLRTVFLSNLLYDVVEDDVRQIFNTVGEITDIRFAKDLQGRFKGYGYVEFSSIEATAAALEKDRVLLNGRPVFVSKCKEKSTDATPQQFKYATGLEKKKLFIRGLPLNLTQDKVTELFNVHGALKEVRLVTYRNGHSKGLAYVEYLSEADASSAVFKMDGSSIDSNIISVALSNPPERKDRSKNPVQSKAPSLGSGSRVARSRSNAKTMLSFVPRAVNKSQPNEENTAKDTANGKEKLIDSKPLSNSDFRSFLLK